MYLVAVIITSDKPVKTIKCSENDSNANLNNMTYVKEYWIPRKCTFVNGFDYRTIVFVYCALTSQCRKACGKLMYRFGCGDGKNIDNSYLILVLF